MNAVNTLVGKSLVGVTGISAGIIAELERVVIEGRKRLDRVDQILAAVRKKLAELSPIIARHLSETVLSAWIYGYDETAKRFPPWLWNEFQTSARSRPPNDPNVKLFGMFDHEPSLKLDIIENAAKRLLERNILTRPQFDQAADEARQQAFTIAGNLTADTIGRFRDFLFQDLHEPYTGLDDFRTKVENHFGTSPIAPGHLENVYRTNFLSSVRDGRETLRQNPIVKSTFPYQEYIPIHDARTRHNHLVLGSLGLNGTGIYRADDPFWDSFTPPWDYQCRCTVRLLTVEQAARAGVKEAQEWLRTGRAPIQPEWRYALIPFQPENDFNGGRGNVGIIVMSLEKFVQEPRKFSSTQFELPPETSKTVLEMAAGIPDEAIAEDGREDNPHITIKYGLHVDTPEEVAAAVADFPPVKVVLGSASVFKGDTHDVVKIDVESADLRALNKVISDAVAHTDTHPTYNPHITLAYVKPGLGEGIAAGMDQASGLELQFDKFIFSAKDRTRTVIPLASLMRLNLTGDRYRAPSGYTHDNPLTIDGKHYTGGQFIPGHEFSKATEEQKKIIRVNRQPLRQLPATPKT
jgi:2'-5' RNA ligase